MNTMNTTATLVDTHTHSAYSGHGKGRPADIISEAASRGLKLIAQTEHLPMPAGMDQNGEFALTQEQLPDYIADVQAARAAHPDLEVILGVEVDWMDNAEEHIRGQLGAHPDNPFELVLGSVHVLTDDPDSPFGFWPFDYSGAIDGWEKRGVDYVWREYFRLWFDAVQSGFFDIMAHPDLPKKLGFRPHFDPQPIWNQMAEAVKAADLMVEVNTSGLFTPAAEIYPGPELLRAFCLAGVPCTLSSDAHAPENVARANDVGLRALYEAGYRAITVPTRDGDRRQIAIDTEG
ncbi:MAG: histidinol-phosphatase HisJ family protein [Coriobacteriales bacterium]|jgi:histidinol-phosphatase (PHP family)|nr:histidinol-phosphatase HisJ family protein [Coriobacteriales bacterium]